MDDWIEENAIRREQQEQERATIHDAAPAIWKALRSSVIEAARRYSRRFPPEMPPHDVLRFPPEGFEHEEFIIEVMEPRVQTFSQEKSKRKLTVGFDRQANAITAKHSGGTSPALTLRIGIDETGSAALFRDGTKISLEDATREILLPLLFPDTLGT